MKQGTRDDCSVEGSAPGRPGPSSLVETLVIGLGNDILSDDRVGLLACRELRVGLPPTVAVEEACLCNLDLLPLLDGFRRVLILDAIWGHEWRAGEVYRFTLQDLPSSFGYRSPHTLSLREMLIAGAEMGLEMPSQVVVLVLGVQDPFSFGEELSPAVGEGLPRLVALAREELSLEV